MSFRRSIGSLAVGALIAVLGPAAPAFADADSPTTMTFEQLGYGDHTARGAYATADYFFPLATADLAQPGATLNLDLSHSPMLAADRSTLTVIVDGVAVTSTYLDGDTVNHGILPVELPPLSGPGATGYSVQLLFFLRLTHDTCEDPSNPALWATVHGTSLLSLPPAAAGRDLNSAATYLTPSAKRPVRIALPDTPGRGELEAGGRVAFTLGRWAANLQTDPILVGTAAGDAASVAVRLGPESPPGQGLVSIGQDPGPPHMIVTGQNTEQLNDAAGALSNPELLGGPSVAVSSQPIAALPAASLPWSSGAASFEQLGFVDQRTTGPGLHTISLLSQRPPGWALRSGSVLDLAVQTSPGIRTDTSWMTATVDGREVGTERLQTGGAPHHYRFNLPADLLNTRLDTSPIRNLTLDLQFDLELPQVACTPIPYDSAWAKVLSTSSWLLPHDARTGLELGTFPFPFVAPDGPGSAIVLPAKPTPEDVAAGLQVEAAAGRWASRPETPPLLIRASDLTASQRHDLQLILIGKADHDMGSSIATAPAAHLRPPAAGASVAIMAETQSPWNRDRTVLSIHSLSGAGLVLAGQALASASGAGIVHGREVALAGRLDSQTLLPAQPPGQPPASLAPTAEAGILERIPPWGIPSVVLLLALLAAVVVVVRLRWLPRLRQRK